MSDIDEMVAWLRSVLDEDERAANTATPGPWFVHDTYLDRGGYAATVLSGEIGHGELRAWLPTMRSDVPWDDERNVWNDAKHIAHHDPAHELNVIAAHRAILDAYEYKNAETLPFGSSGTYALEHVVRLLAAGYRHRDGYRQEWSA